MKNKFQTAQQYKVNKLRKLHSCGNRKVPKTTIIFNMSDCENCPAFLLGLCDFRTNCIWKEIDKNTCYGVKAEKLYPEVLPYRLKQKEYWLNCSAEQFVSDISGIIERKRIKVDLLRFNEAGDFHGQNCINKAEEIAKQLFNRFGIIVYTYTHRTDLNFSNINYLKVKNSTPKKVEGLKSYFLAISKKDMITVKFNKDSANYTGSYRNYEKQQRIAICKGSCKSCKLCALFNEGTIYTIIH